MHVPVKTLSGDAVDVIIESHRTVLELKVKLAELRAEWRPPACVDLKLVCNRKLLANDQQLNSVSDYLALQPEGYVVLTAQGPARKPTPAQASTAEKLLSGATPEKLLASGTAAMLNSLVSPPVDDATAASSTHEAYDRAVAQHKQSTNAKMAQSTMPGSASPASPSPRPPPTARSLSLLEAFAQRTLDAALPLAAASTAEFANDREGAARLGDGCDASGRTNGSSKSGFSISRRLTLESPQLVKLMALPEVQRLLALPQLDGISRSSKQRLLTAVLFQPELQRAVKAGEVTSRMLEAVLTGGILEARPAEAYTALAEEARAAAGSTQSRNSAGQR